MRKTRKSGLAMIVALTLVISGLFITQTTINAGPPWYLSGREVPGPLPPNTWQVPTLDTRINFVYGRANGYDLRMDFAKPRLCRNQKVPLVVFIHGGWWVGGSKSIWGAVHNMCYQLGFAVASMDYRLSGIADHPELINDCKLAVRYLRANAEQFGIDPSKIAIWGASAGGHLAALCNNAGDGDGLEGSGYENYSSRPNASVNWCGITDLTQPWSPTARSMFNLFLGCDPLACLDKAENASPVWQASADDPPLLTIHGDADPVVAYTQAELLADAMYSAKNKGAFLRVLNGNHGLVGTSPTYARVNWVTFAHMARYIEPGLLCDLNIDGKVDTTDSNELISLMGLVGYPPNHQGADVRWNPLADIVPDGKINYKDWQSFCLGLNPPVTTQISLIDKSGMNYTLQVTLQNNGPLNLTDLALSYAFPKELVYVSGPQNIVFSSNTIGISIASFPANSSLQFNLTFALSGTAQTNNGKTLTSKVELSGDDIFAVRSSTNIELPGIEIRKTASKMSITPGEIFSFTINVRNTGKLPLTNLTITDKFPRELEFSSSRPQSSLSSGMSKFSLSKLNPFESTQFIISFTASNKLKSIDKLFLTNQAVVTCDELYPQTTFCSVLIQNPSSSEALQMNINWIGLDTKSGKLKFGDILKLQVSPTGGSSPYSISIDWGDLSRPDHGNTDKEASFEHKYENSGNYTIKLTCTDSFGKSIVKSRIIKVG